MAAFFILTTRVNLVIATNKILTNSMIKVSDNTYYKASEIKALLDTAYVENKHSFFNF